MSWTVIKLNLIFIGLTVLGGVVFGIGPALQVLSDLVQEAGLNYETVTYKKAFSLWKQHFKRSNLMFGSYVLVSGAALYNLYLSIQITGLLWLFIDFLLIVVLLLISVLYLYMILYETNYEISVFNLIKLAFISIFLNFGVFLKVLFGVVSILVLTWFAKGLIAFASFALIMMWCSFTTRDIRALVDGKLVENEATAGEAI